jgi:hypothetical protein
MMNVRLALPYLGGICSDRGLNPPGILSTSKTCSSNSKTTMGFHYVLSYGTSYDN